MCSSLQTLCAWSSHVTTICNKTGRLVGIFYRQFYKHSSQDTMLHLYTSFIRPHLDYATAAWDPFLKKDIELIENVQKFALRVCTKSWDSNYSSLLQTSHLPSLQTRRLHTKLCNLFKITNAEQSPPLSEQNCTQSSYCTTPVPYTTNPKLILSKFYCCMEFTSTSHCSKFCSTIFQESTYIIMYYNNYFTLL